MAKDKITGRIVPTAADYNLKSSDYTLRAFAFIHACGQWEHFVDRVYSSCPALMFLEDTKTDPVSSDVIAEESLQLYEYQTRERIAAVAFGNMVTNASPPKSGQNSSTHGNLNNKKREAFWRDKYNELYKL